MQIPPNKKAGRKGWLFYLKRAPFIPGGKTKAIKNLNGEPNPPTIPSHICLDTSCK